MRKARAPKAKTAKIRLLLYFNSIWRLNDEHEPNICKEYLVGNFLPLHYLLVYYLFMQIKPFNIKNSKKGVSTKKVMFLFELVRFRVYIHENGRAQ